MGRFFQVVIKDDGYVSTTEFNQALELFLSRLQREDICMFYF